MLADELTLNKALAPYEPPKTPPPLTSRKALIWAAAIRESFGEDPEVAAAIDKLDELLTALDR